MKLYSTVFAVLLLLCLCKTTESLFGSSSFQDYVDNFIDATKFKINGILSLNDSSISRIWSFFKSKYGRAYSSLDEEKQRLRVFQDHLEFVINSNLEKLRTFQLELNEFADWTLQEFNAWKKGLVISSSVRRRVFQDDDREDQDYVLRRALQKLYQQHYHTRRLKRSAVHKRHHKMLTNTRGFSDWFWNIIFGDTTNNTSQSTDSFDWRTKNVVGSIKNQLKCGSCYGFATAAVLESLYAIKTKSSVIDLSPQQIVDCSSNGNNGCNGGNFGPSLRYIKGQGNKLATWASYPYVGTRQTCKTSGLNQINFGNIDYGSITQGDEKGMATALVNYGPIFIGLDVDSQLFMFYKAGVLSINNCPNRLQDMDHAMVAVGYGYDSALKMSYWIIKNSWGAQWGENGYVRLAKDKGNMCGITTMAQYAKLT